jgi:hypothetical protein
MVGNEGGMDASDGGADAGGGGTDAPSDASNDGACSPPYTVCGGTCVNTNNNGQNCGACGHDCLGGGCIGGVCQPVTLASGLGDALGVAVDATNVYFTEGNAGTVAKAPLTATGVVTPLATGLPTTVGVAVDTSGNVYFATNAPSGGITKIPAGTTTLTPIASQANAFWLVTDGAHVYWTSNTGNASVWQVGVTGGTPTAIATGQAWTTGIAMTATNVYWGTESNNDGIWSYAIGPGTVTQIVTGQNNARAVAVDSSNVYWADDSTSGVVYQQPLGGGTQTQLSSGDGNPYWMVADAVNSHVYWTDSSSGHIMRATIGMAGSGALLWSDSAPRQITQDAKAIYWASHGNGKVMMLAK